MVQLSTSSPSGARVWGLASGHRAAEPMMPPDDAENFRKALPQTPGHAEIEATLAEEPLRTMFTTGGK